jgi:energy-converting hydrogenase B subunit D
MTVLQLAAFLAVAAGGTATVLTREPLRQAIVAGIFGLALGLLFFGLGAPDVALSELAVSGIAVPVMVLLALAKLQRDEEDE